jgi:hypothetical protein
MDLLLLLPTRHHIVVRRGAMVWVLFVNESGTFENPVEEPLPVVQELSMDTHFLAWIWMVIVAVPLLEQGAAS